MVTNGFISDYEFAKAEIKKLSILPLSIIIVGIGEGSGRDANGNYIDFFGKLQE